MTIEQNEKILENLEKILEKCPEVKYVGDKILRQRTLEVNHGEAILIAEKLKTTLLNYRKIVGYGRGLSAPQIGENKSVFVTYIDDEFQVYINPRIVSRSNLTNFYREGCSSCFFMCADVKRPISITIEFTNEKDEIKVIEAKDFLARLLQHEYDHLQGILNIDIAEPASIELMTNDPLKEQLRNNY